MSSVRIRSGPPNLKKAGGMPLLLARLLLLLFSLSELLSEKGALASTRDLPQDLTREVLSESVATAFEVFPTRAQDFYPVWLEKSPNAEKSVLPSGLKVSVVPGSIQWVRISGNLVLPRGRLRVELPSADRITLKTGGYIESVEGSSLEVPVALLSIDGSQVEVSIKKGSQTTQNAFRIESRARMQHRVFWDSSCSPFVPQVTQSGSAQKTESADEWAGQWVYFSCRMVRSALKGHDLPSLEVYVHWDGAPLPLKFQNDPVEPMAPGVWVFRLGPQRTQIQVENARGQKLAIQFSVPQRLSYASLGLGVGPYSYFREDPGFSLSRVQPLTTFYGSYFLTEHSRMVFFDAYAPGQRWYNDFGVYFNNETSRALDDRLSVNVLLGFHIIGFRATSGVAFRFGVPQGFEMIFRDAFLPRYSASIGGFFYPPIGGKSYYNTWIRYGTTQLFAEINYIQWSELGLQDEPVFTRTVGLCVGAPLLLFK
jgi:hypothetical protein